MPAKNNLKFSKLGVLLLPLSVLLALIAQVFIVFPAQAICRHEGQEYGTGETVGPYVCMPDGTWKPQ